MTNEGRARIMVVNIALFSVPMFNNAIAGNWDTALVFLAAVLGWVSALHHFDNLQRVLNDT